ncbi:MAG: hypothetical protein ACOYXT_16020 [Bacteroidota bacterium]
METRFKLLLVLLAMLLISTISFCQENDQPQHSNYEIKTLFNTKSPRASGGYGAVSNKFTTIDGKAANMVEMYGGWYINHRFLIGIGGAAVTNDIRVPEEFSAKPGVKMSYEYGQCGLMTEYVIGSDRAVHLSFQLFSGAGFTVQYERYGDWDEDSWDHDDAQDENWFFVTEPGVKAEINVFRWLRFAPGVSYRAAFNSKAKGLSDSDISGMSVNLTLKVGKF